MTTDDLAPVPGASSELPVASLVVLLLATVPVVVAFAVGWLQIALHEFVLLLIAGLGVLGTLEAGRERRRTTRGESH
jgi:hypothetical protein